MVDEAEIQEIVAETMASNPVIEGMVACNADGEVIFGHTLSDSIKHKKVADLVVKLSSLSSQLSGTVDKGELKEVSITSEGGYVIILGDIELVLAAIVGEEGRESMGLIRMAVRRALRSMVE
ncbi:MAG: roadblock/LC7 domain-containing protein [Candidatus Thorarchaeota archaeon]